MKIYFIIILLFLAGANNLYSQDSVSVRYNLNIITSIPDAAIYIDSINAGVTPLSNFKLLKGIHNIKIINPTNSGRSAWEDENILFNQFDIKSDTTIRASFRYLYSINSDPFNAEVLTNDSLLGYTPLRFFGESILNWRLDLKKSGYRTAKIDLSDYNSNRTININLLPDVNYTRENIIFKDKNTNFSKKRNFPLIAALGAATLGGAFATINLKNKANDFYDSYLNNLNQGDLSSSNRYDIYSLVSLILTQAALGTLIYFLFFD